MNKEDEERALRLHKESIVVNGLDYAPAFTNPDGFKKHIAAGVTASHTTVIATTDNLPQAQSRLKNWHNVFEEHKDEVLMVTTAKDIERAKREGKSGIILGTQHPDIIGDNLDMLWVYYKLGMRIFQLSYYNSGTFWLDIYRLLGSFELDRSDLKDPDKVRNAVRRMSRRMPTYMTIKDVKKRWGKGQEDIFPVAQFEKLWGDMTALPDINCNYLSVSRMRGQQLKEISELDGWLRDGSAEHIKRLCGFDGG